MNQSIIIELNGAQHVRWGWWLTIGEPFADKILGGGAYIREGIFFRGGDVRRLIRMIEKK